MSPPDARIELVDERLSPARAFEDRSVRLETTFGGAGVLHGDLTPACTPMAALG